jgi:hypothetical protein
MSEIERLQKAILDMHGCDSMHAGSITVHETFQDKAVWQGVVEVFFLPSHPKTKEAYAWSYKNDDGQTRYIAVLGIPPINSPYEAVQAYLASEPQKKK